MSARLLFGDAFTMVVQRTRSQALVLLHCRVDARDPGGIRSTDWPGLYEGVLIEDEGITWCRGHVAEDSKEGRALLVAAHLHTSARIPVQHNDGWGPIQGR